MKNKPNSIRTYDSDGFRRRAACVCVRDDSEIEVRIIQIFRFVYLKLVLKTYNFI